MALQRSIILSFILLAVLATAAPGARKSSPVMETFETKYYVIHTDIDLDDAREAAIRMTKMAEEYHERTRDFSGTIRSKLPFYLYRTEQEYLDGGGAEGSAGLFTGDKLMAIAGDKAGGGTWHVVQHEGFHQFALATMGWNLPIWVNEGLAEYFGEGVFTGDGFVTGLIPQFRLERVRKLIDSNRLLSIRDMMMLSHEQWNNDLSIVNYDQAWSMVHFLAHGENGKYQKAFTNFMLALSKGKQWIAAWQDAFGDAKGFQEHWQKYWTELPDNPTADRYAMANVGTLTSFLARSVSQKQTFDNFEEFTDAAADKKLKWNKDDWLPPHLLEGALAEAKKSGGKWTITPAAGAAKTPQLVFEMDDGTRIVGTFTIKSAKIEKVTTEIDDNAKRISEARELIDKGKKEPAKVILQDVIKKNPKSTAAESARKMMGETK
jgi:hypothetical protein